MADKARPLPWVFVGIVSYNSLDDLPGCLSCLSAQTYSRVSITMWDNASQDGSAAWATAHAPQMNTIAGPENLGFGRGHNAILSTLHLNSEDFYLPLNPDVRLAPDYIAQMVHHLGELGAGWGIGRLDLCDEAGQPTGRLYSVGHALRWDGYFYNVGYGLPVTSAPQQPVEVFGAPGAAPLYSGAFVEALSSNGALFDEAFFLYGEDTDLDWRARHAGWRCWHIPQAVALHRGSTPAQKLRTHALANRYAGAVRNTRPGMLPALLVLITAHCVLRLIVSPSWGWGLIRQLMALLPHMFATRPGRMMSPAELRRWLRWSAQQQTTTPVTWGQRLTHYLRTRRT